MERQLILGERIMYADGNIPVNCLFTAKVKGAVKIKRLRAALHKIQLKHPLLRAVIREDERQIPFFFYPENISEIPVRIVERYCDDHWEEESKAEWSTPFDLQMGPLARVVWMKSDDVSELILVCPHAICDGTTFVALMHELLLLIDHPEKEIGTYRSFRSIHELVSDAVLTNKWITAKAKFFLGLSKLVLSAVSRGNPLPKGEDYFLHWRLSEEITAELVRHCKEEKTSVHTALCIAFLTAFKEIRDLRAKNRVICPVDIRRFIPEIKNDNMFAFAPVVKLSMDRNEDMTFWDKARKFNADMTEAIAKVKAHELLMVGEYFHSIAKKIVKYLRLTDGNHDVTLSNMGRLDIAEQYDSFEVEAIYSPTVAFPWRNPNTIVVSTYKGVMDFTFMSNDAFLKYEDADAIKEKAMGILLDQLHVLEYSEV